MGGRCSWSTSCTGHGSRARCGLAPVCVCACGWGACADRTPRVSQVSLLTTEKLKVEDQIEALLKEVPARPRVCVRRAGCAVA